MLDISKPVAVDLSIEGDRMKENIVNALSQSALEGKTVIQVQIFSQQTKYAITTSAEFFRGAFLGVPVVFFNSGEFPAEDFVLIHASYFKK